MLHTILIVLLFIKREMMLISHIWMKRHFWPFGTPITMVTASFWWQFSFAQRLSSTWTSTIFFFVFLIKYKPVHYQVTTRCMLRSLYHNEVKSWILQIDWKWTEWHYLYSYTRLYTSLLLLPKWVFCFLVTYLNNV